jgi:arylsulfatase A-like enzyme
MKKLSRRDFLKTISLGSLAALAPASVRSLIENAVVSAVHPSVIILVFDTMSARNLSLYGYRRGTTPNFERFAERATVFHNHISSGNFTSPGTASIFTGTYPWTHRAINQSGLILRSLSPHNIFSALDSQYNKFVFTQNVWADYLLNQFENDIDIHLLPASFSLADGSLGAIFPNDLNAGYRTFDDFLFQVGHRPASLIFGPIEKQHILYELAKISDKGYARGLPHDVSNPKHFRLEDVFNGVDSQLTSLSAPFFSYVHLYAPHEPYRPHAEFENKFKDNWKPDPKPESRFSDGSTNAALLNRRTNYDEYVANVDAEFGRLIDSLTEKGVLDNCIVVVTSDHGQLFERGIHGHSTPLLFEPVIQVPLLVSTPGQVTRQDVYSPTNHVDLLPTLLHLTSQEIPAWCEGEVLPKLGGLDDPKRAIYSVEAKTNSAFAPLSIVTVAMRRNNHKLIYYSGYGYEPWFELYDMDVDPEELTDLYPSTPSFATSLRDELMTSLERANQSLGK